MPRRRVENLSDTAATSPTPDFSPVPAEQEQRIVQLAHRQSGATSQVRASEAGGLKDRKAGIPESYPGSGAGQFQMVTHDEHRCFAKSV